MHDAYRKGSKEGSDRMKMVEVIDKNIITYSKQFLREETFEKLVRVARKAPKPLVLYEGWRPLKKQIEMFEKEKKLLKEQYPELDEAELCQKANKFVAIPERAVHVTGGAVDVSLLDFDMGTEYLCFDGRQATAYYDEKNEKIKENRKTLCNLMESEGFVNFYNEWWHFEYGVALWCYKNNCKPIFDAVKDIK